VAEWTAPRGNQATYWRGRIGCAATRPIVGGFAAKPSDVRATRIRARFFVAFVRMWVGARDCQLFRYFPGVIADPAHEEIEVRVPLAQHG
jgi:hypothetical protein